MAWFGLHGVNRITAESTGVTQMIVSAKTALQKINDGTATVTGRVTDDRSIQFISLDDHELLAVLHVEVLTDCNDCKQLECVVTELAEPSFEEVEAWLEDNTWL